MLMLLQEPRWASRILHITVLLPKTVGDPQSWEETRPITLSCTVLKWFSQLLLLRGGGRIQDDQPLQWAARGKQAPELLVVLQRVVRHAKDCELPSWIVEDARHSTVSGKSPWAT